MEKIMKFRKRKVMTLAYLETIVFGLAITIFNPIITPGIENKRLSSDNKQTMNSLEAEEGSFSENNISSTTTPSPTPSPIPTPTPYPVYPLKKETSTSSISTLIKKYYEAKVSCDIDTLKAISSDPSAVIDKESLEQLVEGIEDYRNIECYTKDTYMEGAYIVYVYHEIKFISIDTCAPALSKLFVVTDDTGELKIFDGTMTEEFKTYFNARSEDEDVLELMEHTEEQAKQAKEQDQKLKAYWDAR
jgi:hypothetical protein